MVDLCGRGALPGVLVAYAVPPDFLDRVRDYPALQQRIASPLPLSVRSPQASLVDLERMDLDPHALLVAMGGRIQAVFEAARSVKLDPIIQAANLSRVAQEAASAQWEVSHRRVFVKTWVGILYDQVAVGERPITSQEVTSRIQSGARQLIEVSAATTPGASYVDF